MHARLVAYGTGAGVFLLDRITKCLVESHISLWETCVIIPGFFNIIHTQNPGAAFSLLAGASPEWRNALLVVLSTIALILVASLLWAPSPSSLGHGRLQRLGLSLILGGALGNIYDRIARGAVTDFLDFYVGAFHWPAFNAADSAITIGAALVILDLWRSRGAAQKA